MIKTTETFTRLIALIFSTAVFAGLWSNDQPVERLALKTAPIQNSTVQNSPIQNSPIQIQPEWVPVAEPIIESASLKPDIRSTSMQISLMQRSKQFSIEPEDLLIASETLQAHLDQLPLGLATGDYRIIDSLGGTGWLRVRTDGIETEIGEAGDTFSTTVDHDSLHYVQVARIVLRRSAVTVTR